MLIGAAKIFGRGMVVRIDRIEAHVKYDGTSKEHITQVV